MIDPAETPRHPNWWPLVPPGVEEQQPELTNVGGVVRTVPVWSDGIFRTKLWWPEDLISQLSHP